jgi:hypothetical protein
MWGIPEEEIPAEDIVREYSRPVRQPNPALYSGNGYQVYLSRYYLSLWQSKKKVAHLQIGKGLHVVNERNLLPPNSPIIRDN